jgi:hypothetical protein
MVRAWRACVGAGAGAYTRIDGPCPTLPAYDVISRAVDPVTQVLSSTRVVLKKGNLPRWGLHVRLPPLSARARALTERTVCR